MTVAVNKFCVLNESFLKSVEFEVSKPVLNRSISDHVKRKEEALLMPLQICIVRK